MDEKKKANDLKQKRRPFIRSVIFQPPLIKPKKRQELHVEIHIGEVVGVLAAGSSARAEFVHREGHRKPRPRKRSRLSQHLRNFMILRLCKRCVITELKHFTLTQQLPHYMLTDSSTNTLKDRTVTKCCLMANPIIS